VSDKGGGFPPPFVGNRNISLEPYRDSRTEAIVRDLTSVASC
jgi:hypothetical protein